jgi:predicted nuclease of restriction endonuclease-like (RecB) superfamily
MNKQRPNHREYKEWLGDLKRRIKQSQIKASVRVNTEMLELYWGIGADIVERQAESKWGSGVIRQLSKDIKSEFPNLQGFSEQNLRSMRRFYQFYGKDSIQQQVVVELKSPKSHQVGGQLPSAPIQHQLGVELQDSPIGQQVVVQIESTPLPQILGGIPWGHHVAIMARCKSMDEAMFYVHKTLENGWSRAVLLNFIDSGLYASQGKAANNFSRLLPEIQSELAAAMVKDPYQFDFIALTENYKERELEDALTDNITKFLLELGQGFAYLGRQMPIQVGAHELTMDLLFYHMNLRCYIVIELKATGLKAEHAGKLGVYVTAVNHQLKTDADNPTIGLLVCKSKDRVMAEYAVESSSQPIGISEYELSQLIPDDYKSVLPSIEEIEEGLNETVME